MQRWTLFLWRNPCRSCIYVRHICMIHIHIWFYWDRLIQIFDQSIVYAIFTISLILVILVYSIVDWSLSCDTGTHYDAYIGGYLIIRWMGGSEWEWGFIIYILIKGMKINIWSYTLVFFDIGQHTDIVECIYWTCELI